MDRTKPVSKPRKLVRPTRFARSAPVSDPTNASSLLLKRGVRPHPPRPPHSSIESAKSVHRGPPSPFLAVSFPARRARACRMVCVVVLQVFLWRCSPTTAPSTRFVFLRQFAWLGHRIGRRLAVSGMLCSPCCVSGDFGPRGSDRSRERLSSCSRDAAVAGSWLTCRFCLASSFGSSCV